MIIKYQNIVAEPFKKRVELKIIFNKLSQTVTFSRLRIKTNFLDTFETIYANYYTMLFNAANKMVNDKDEAADIVQEVFIALYYKTEKGLMVEYPKSWLYRATLNKCIDATKSKKRFLKIEHSNIMEKADEENHETEKREIVKKALNKLSPKEKSIAVLYGEGLSYKEIAEITGIKITSVGKTLTRTLEKLAEYLKKSAYELHE